MGTDLVLKGEFVVLVAGASDSLSSEDHEVARVFDLLAETLPAKEAVALTAKITGASRNRVYSVTRGITRGVTGEE